MSRLGRCALGRCAVGALVSALLVVPGLSGAAESTAPATVTLKNSKAVIIPASDLTPGFMTYHDGDPSVRGKFRVNAVTIADALNARREKPIMIFVLDRARAASNGCTLHEDILFSAMINTPSVEGKQEVVFGIPNADGQGVMPLGAYHDMERRGCIAVRSRSPEELAAAQMDLAKTPRAAPARPKPVADAPASEGDDQAQIKEFPAPPEPDAPQEPAPADAPPVAAEPAPAPAGPAPVPAEPTPMPMPPLPPAQ